MADAKQQPIAADRGGGGAWDRPAPGLARRDPDADVWKARLDGMLRATPNLVCAVRGDDHVVELASDAVREWIGARALVGRPLREVLPGLATDDVRAAITEVRETGRPFRRTEVALRMPEQGDEGERFFDLVGRALRSPAGEIDLVAVFAQDVTELVRARKAAESSSRAKDDFLAMLGHELRNPLAPIRTALELLSPRDGSPLPLELRVIRRQVEHLVDLVDDLLDVSRINRGKIELRREIVDLAEVLSAAIEMTAPLMHKREHRVRVRAPGRELWVDGDRARLTQIFSNLLTNAAKYSEPACEIAVTAELEGTEVVVRVRDEGVGIAPELLPRVFDLFEQGRRTLDRAMGGLGLGLAIVRSMTRLHGGDVTAASEGLGRGSEFTVRLPAADEPTERVVAVSERAPQPAIVRPTRRRVLVVDDNEDAAELIAVALATGGYETAVALDGPKALETAAWFRPHAAVLDLGLPVMDGLELAARMRQTPDLAGVRLVAVTGYGADGDRQRTREAGFDAHLLKPIEMADLEAAIEGRTTSVPPPRERALRRGSGDHER